MTKEREKHTRQLTDQLKAVKASFSFFSPFHVFVCLFLCVRGFLLQTLFKLAPFVFLKDTFGAFTKVIDQCWQFLQDKGKRTNGRY
jgi:hypothetical protein